VTPDHDLSSGFTVPALSPPNFSGVRAHTAAAPGLQLDPGIGSLSLGISTLDGFATGSAALTAKHEAEIADVAGKLTMLLGRMPGGQVTVTGHTDLVGGEEANLTLGRRRAEAVRAALVRAGVPPFALKAASAGKSAPAIQTGKAEPRNRRVEVRFNGQLVVPGTGSGPLPRADLTLKPGLIPPAGVPPFTPGPLLAGPAPATPKPGPSPARAASPGDLLKAISKLPQVDAWIERQKTEQKDKFKALPTRDKIVLGSVGVSIATLAGLGISTDPAASKAVLSALNGQEVEIAPGLKLKAVTPGGSVGAALTIELSYFIPVLK
jgi:outer membrane protein OmpA-like peptidoglycan-associated protein